MIFFMVRCVSTSSRECTRPKPYHDSEVILILVCSFAKCFTWKLGLSCRALCKIQYTRKYVALIRSYDRCNCKLDMMITYHYVRPS